MFYIFAIGSCMRLKSILNDNEALVRHVVNFFLSAVIDPEKNKEILEKCSQNKMLSHEPNHTTCLKIGVLSTEDFMYYANQYISDPIRIQPVLIEHILDKLCDNFVLSKEKILQYRQSSTYKVNKEIAQFYVNNGAIYNLIFGYVYIAERYKPEVFKVVVNGSTGDENIGTGFCFKFTDHKHKIHANIITNKHVAQYEKNLRILTYEDKLIEHGQIFHSEKYDLSIIEVPTNCSPGTFNFFHQAEVLDEVMTLGYPPVPLTRESYQLAHKGELNAFVKDYWGNNFILFSAKIAPGNSGGPLINNMGLVVGIVVQSLENEVDNAEVRRQPYFAALPSKDILDFINHEYLEAKKRTGGL